MSDDDLADRESERARNAPWDTTRIVVRRSADALGIFDRSSQSSAGRIMAWTEESLATVRRDVPEQWRGDVVVYALSSERLLRRMGTRFLDRAAIAFPVFDDSDSPTRRVATRVLINPRYLPRNEIEGTYLLTHEITHVALARTSGDTPTWVQEGLADYVATRGADPARWLPTDATAARARKGADAMPSSTFFGDDDPGFDYDLSLAACAYLARRFGQDRLWAFLDRLDEAGRRDGDAEGAWTRSCAACSTWTASGWPGTRPGSSSSGSTGPDGSGVDRAHVAVAVAGHRAAGHGRLERGQVLGAERDRGGADVLLEVRRPAWCPGSAPRPSPCASTQASASWPGWRPCRRRARDLRDERQVGVERVAGEPREVRRAPRVVLVEVVGPRDRAGEDAAAERRVGHQADAQLAQQRQDLVLQVAGEQASTRSAGR